MAEANRLAIVGATGEVGKALLAALEDVDFSFDVIHALASAQSVDDTVMFNNRALLIADLESFDFAQADIAVFAVPADVARIYVPKALAAGCRVIDHSDAYRLDGKVPLMAAGMSEADAKLLACPSPLTSLLYEVINTLSPLAGLESVHATLLRPVSVAGRAGVRELAGQTGELLNARGITPAVFPVQISFNTIPVIGELSSNQVIDELDRLLEPPVPLSISEVVVPVFYGMTLGLVLQTKLALAVEKAVSALSKAGFVFHEVEENQEVASPVGNASNQEGITVVDLNELPAPLNGIRLWLLADNIRQAAVGPTVAILSKWKKRL